MYLRLQVSPESCIKQMYKLVGNRSAVMADDFYGTSAVLREEYPLFFSMDPKSTLPSGPNEGAVATTSIRPAPAVNVTKPV